MVEIWYEYTVSILCLVAVLFCLWQTWYLKKDFFNPVNIYVFAQCFTLGVAYLQLDAAMTDFKFNTWIVWGGAMFSFIAGSGVYYLVNDRKNLQFVRTDVCEIYDWRKHFYISLVLLLLFMIGAIGMTAKVGTLIILSDDISKWVSADIDYGVFINVSVASSPLVVLFFMVAAFKSTNPSKSIRVASLCISIFLIPFTLCVYPSRTALFLSSCFILILFNFLKKRIPVRLIVGALVVAFALFITVALFRSQYGTNTLEGMAAGTALSIPYNYIANNYWNLDFMLNSPTDFERHGFTYGVDALNGIFEYTHLPGAIRTSMGWDGMFNESVMKIPGYNTTGYLWEVYKDWGIPGTVIFPFVISFFMTFLYERMKVARSPRLWMLFTMFLYYIGWWFFLAGYKFGTFWLWIYIILLGTKLCEKKRVVNASHNS